MGRVNFSPKDYVPEYRPFYELLSLKLKGLQIKKMLLIKMMKNEVFFFSRLPSLLNWGPGVHVAFHEKKKQS